MRLPAYCYTSGNSEWSNPPYRNSNGGILYKFLFHRSYSSATTGFR